MTKAVLGIDAAWTAHHHSGVAVIVQTGSRWRLAGSASRYADFHRLAGRAVDGAPHEADEILDSARQLTGVMPQIVAIDMPLAEGPITGRRVSDNLISSAYGGRGAGTHSPSSIRPGAVGAALGAGFIAAGYPLAVHQPPGRAMIEVYPHPALIELTGRARRLPYKIARAGKYWPDAAPLLWRARLLEEWRGIILALGAHIDGLEALAMPEAEARVTDFKAFEDRLDAIICCWVGAMVLEGRARCYGDHFSGVWVPLAGAPNGLQAVGEGG